MKIDTYKFPRSGFLSVEKDLNIIMDRILKNERLKKLLFYSTTDSLSRPNLTNEQIDILLKNNIKIVPKMKVDQNVYNYLYITFGSFSTNATNPEFRNNVIMFDILCHFDYWQLQDSALRPYRIAAELDSMFADFKLTNFGRIKFVAADTINISDEFGGLCLMYQVIHGGEDKKNPENPVESQNIIANFNQIFNEES